VTRLRVFLNRMLGLFTGHRADVALQNEVRAHLEFLAAEHERRGLPRQAAREAARRDFGGIEPMKQRYGDQQRLRWVDEMWRDTRYAIRVLVKAPGFTLATIVILALGIGANTAIFSLLNATVTGMSRFQDADRLVMVWSTPSGDIASPEPLTIPEYFFLRDENRVFDQMGAMMPWIGTVDGATDGQPADRVVGQRVTSSLFPLLGVQPALGRVLMPGEDTPGGIASVLVISHRFWQRWFAADPRVIGKTVRLDGRLLTIVGVTPPDFSFFVDDADYWVPLRPTPFQLQSSTRIFRVAAHLKPGITIENAQASLSALNAELERLYPDRSRGRALWLQPLDEAYFGSVRRTLSVLQAAVGVILLIGCANVAGLLLIRASARQREVLVRAALGASRRRIVWQFLTESLLLSAVGGAFAVLTAWAGLRILITNGPAWLSSIDHATIDAPVLGVTLVVAAMTGVVFGVGPALQVSKASPASALQEFTRGGASARGHRRLHGTLVVAQVGFSVVLLVAAGLAIKSVWRLQNASLGIDASDVLSFETRLPAATYAGYVKQVAGGNGSALVEVSPVPALLFDRVVHRIREAPGVLSGAGISRAPLNGETLPITFAIEGRLGAEAGAGADREAPSTNYYLVTPDFFDTLRIPVVRGRDFTDRDTVDAPWVAIVNQAMARRYWPNEDPIGKRVTLDIVPDERPREIVGVVGDTPASRFEQAAGPILYVPHVQQLLHSRAGGIGGDRVAMTFVVRLSQRPDAVVPALRRAVAEVDPTIPMAQVEMVDAYLARQIETPRYYMWLLGLLGALATTLTACGVYGVIAYSLAQRAREIAIRVAVGASPRQVIALTVRHGALLLAVGLLFGFLGALAATRFLTVLLWNVAVTDPGTFVGVAGLLAAVGVLASLVPTYRALRLNPRAVLCEE
jgi:putative ABC transport system permease protein